MTSPLEHYDVQVRWSDSDSLGHVNHSTVLVYLEVGRDAVLGSRGISASDYVIRHCSVDYQHELRPAGSHIRYRCDGIEVGTTSVRLVETLDDDDDDDGRPAVRATFTLVMWDPVKRTSRAVTDDERKALEGSAS